MTLTDIFNDMDELIVKTLGEDVLIKEIEKNE